MSVATGEFERLAQASCAEIDRVEVLIVPVGSTEQHGAHLPLETDTVIAMAVADELAARIAATGYRVAVAEPIAYGASGEHEGFPGTISIGTATLSHLLVEFVRSAARWVSSVLFVNGHGGNRDGLESAIGQLLWEGHRVRWLPCATSGMDAHAGFAETSLMLHLAADRVRLDKAERGVLEPLESILPRLREGGLLAVAPNGVLGDPTAATAADGARLLQAMVAEAFSLWSSTHP